MATPSDDACAGFLWGVLLTLGIVFAAAVVSASQPPSPRETEGHRVIEGVASKSKKQTEAKNELPQRSPSAVLQGKAAPEKRPHQNVADPQREHAALDELWDYLLNPLVYFTAILTVVAIGQWRLARNQAEQRRAEQRAWVAYQSVERLKPETEPPFKTRATIKNTGQTPARIYRQVAEIFFKPTDTLDLSVEFEAVEQKLHAGERQYQVVLSPRNHHSFRRTHEGQTVPGGGVIPFLIGMVYYEDVFGRKHTTTCCYRWFPEENKFIGHRRHNTMT